MKTLIAIFLSITLISASAQETPVCIKTTTAEYFLEADDERYLLRDVVITLENQNKELVEDIFIKKSIIGTYKAEELIYVEEYNKLIEQIEEGYEYEELLEKKLDKEIRWRNVLGGAAVGAVVGSAVGLPVVGAVVGGGVVYVVRIFKKKK